VARLTATTIRNTVIYVTMLYPSITVGTVLGMGQRLDRGLDCRWWGTIAQGPDCPLGSAGEVAGDFGGLFWAVGSR
jgi:hypothetical protein